MEEKQLEKREEKKLARRVTMDPIHRASTTAQGVTQFFVHLSPTKNEEIPDERKTIATFRRGFLELTKLN